MYFHVGGSECGISKKKEWHVHKQRKLRCRPKTRKKFYITVLQRQTLVLNAGYVKLTGSKCKHVGITKNQKILRSNPETHLQLVYLSACILSSGFALRPGRFHMKWLPFENLKYHWGATPIQWHVPSINTSCQKFDVLLKKKKKLAAQSLYMEENAPVASKSLALPGFASVFPRGIMHRAMDQHAVC